MPTLPTLTVTTEQANRMLAAYGAIDPSKTPQENYLKWLTHRIIDEVLAFEAQQRLVSFRTSEKSAELNARVALGDDRVTPEA